MELVQSIGPVPPSVLDPVLQEIQELDWDQLPYKNGRERAGAFKNSVSLSLRVHDAPAKILSVAEYGQIVECRDSPVRWLYPATNALVRWIYNKVQGLHLGRIQLAKLSANGIIPEHVDAGEYFDRHNRYHVPIITTPEVIFSSVEEENRMAFGNLYRLRNLDLHGVRNEAPVDRVHLIVDIQTAEYQWLA